MQLQITQRDIDSESDPEKQNLKDDLLELVLDSVNLIEKFDVEMKQHHSGAQTYHC